jgi:glycosyltransferase involved in cell wall biosynthesis
MTANLVPPSDHCLRVPPLDVGQEPRSDGAARRAREPRVLACCGGFVIYGGMERMVFEVLRIARENGAVVHCIVNDWENHRIAEAAESIGGTWSTGFYRHYVRRHMRSPFKWIRFGVGILRTSWGLLRDARRFAPTHLLVPEHRAVLVNLPALLALRFTGTRIVMRLGVPPDTTPFYRRLWKYVVNPAISEFICNSRFTRDELLANGIQPRKVRYVYNAVPTRPNVTVQPVERDERSVIFVGQMIPMKGAHLVLAAARELVRRGHDIRLDLVGDVDGWEAPEYAGYKQSLKEAARSPELVSRVRLLGWREDVPSLMKRAAVHCCPSLPEHREGFGIVNVEAKAAGIPSVVFPTGALPELITHAVDGWICRDCTPEALADGLQYFLSEPNRARDAGWAAKASLSRFSREAFAAEWLSAFGIYQLSSTPSENGPAAGGAANSRRELPPPRSPLNGFVTLTATSLVRAFGRRWQRGAASHCQGVRTESSRR